MIRVKSIFGLSSILLNYIFIITCFVYWFIRCISAANSSINSDELNVHSHCEAFCQSAFSTIPSCNSVNETIIIIWTDEHYIICKNKLVIVKIIKRAIYEEKILAMTNKKKLVGKEMFLKGSKKPCCKLSKTFHAAFMWLLYPSLKHLRNLSFHEICLGNLPVTFHETFL